MTEQWFLDLDGVRSGPYQTPEVMSLIAEGEVLPHHRISTSLKDAPWMTILDWRLEQARSLQKHSKLKTPEPTPEVGFFEDQTLPEPTFEIKAEELPPSAPTPPPAPPPAPEPILEPKIQPTVQPPVEDLKLEAAEVRAELEAELTPPPSPDRPRRDPMAEMYDMLQNTKQKREAKQLHSAQHASQVEEARIAPSTQSSGMGKMIAIGLGLALIGFSLGQLFQQSTQPSKEMRGEESKSTPTPFPSPTARTESKTEVVDRSNEKMTIRTVLPKQNTRTAPSAAPERTRERRSNDAEIEELKDLKKELQELKALKEQLKENPNPDDFIDADSATGIPEGSTTEGMVEGQMPLYPADSGMGPNGRSGRPPQGSPIPSDVHY